MQTHSREQGQIKFSTETEAAKELLAIIFKNLRRTREIPHDWARSHVLTVSKTREKNQGIKKIPVYQIDPLQLGNFFICFVFLYKGVSLNICT